MPDTQSEPMLNEDFPRAVRLACHLHRFHSRKTTPSLEPPDPVPYASHLLSVAALVIEDGGDEDEAIAAMLHDALEDCSDQISAAEIEEKFNARVRKLVRACTDTPEDFEGGEKPDWETRKRIYIEKIASGTIPHRVSLSDKVHNARCIVRDLQKVGEEVWELFSVEKPKTLWYYRALADAYREGGSSGFLIDEFDRLVSEMERLGGVTEGQPAHGAR